MREILFRGKRIDNGEWIYGSLVTNIFFHMKSGKSIQYILNVSEIDYDCFEDLTDGYGYYEVDTDTIGQYIGCNDDNNNPIFEGDFVRRTDMDNDLIEIYWEAETGGFRMLYLEYDEDYNLDELPSCEIIGNIYDNPELLEVEE